MAKCVYSGQVQKSSTSPLGPASFPRGTRLQMLLQGDTAPEGTGSYAGEAEHLLS